MQTKLTYLEDADKMRDTALIVAGKKDENGHYLLLDKTIFYPQGGGQPCDQGTLEVGLHIIPIHSVKRFQNEVRHYTDQDYNFLATQEVTCILDAEIRALHSKLHTAGHLISNIVEGLYPEWRAVKGHHFPDQCYVEFSCQNQTTDISIEMITTKIKQFIEDDLSISIECIEAKQLQNLCPNVPYHIPQDQPIRIMRIGDLPFSPCGGTHIKSLSQLEGLQLKKGKVKKGTIKLSYTL